MVPLNARSVLGPKQRSAAMKWQRLIGDALNGGRRSVMDGEDAAMDHGQGAFRCVVSKQMVGIFVAVWTRSGLRRHVRHPGVSAVGAGVLGRLGNKVGGGRSRHARTVHESKNWHDGVRACASTYAGRGVRPVLAARHELLLRLLPPGLRRRGRRRATPERQRGGHPLEDELPQLRRRAAGTGTGGAAQEDS